VDTGREGGFPANANDMFVAREANERYQALMRRRVEGTTATRVFGGGQPLALAPEDGPSLGITYGEDGYPISEEDTREEMIREVNSDGRLVATAARVRAAMGGPPATRKSWPSRRK
jgi:hypothetical protein